MLFDLTQYLAQSDALAPLREGFARGARRQWVSGVRGTGKSLAVAALVRARLAMSPVRAHLILTPSQERAETLFADLSTMLGDELPLALFPSLEGLLYEETSPDFQLVRDRMSVLSRLVVGTPLVVIATADAALHRTLPPAVLRATARTLRLNEEVAPAALASWLAEAGYQREALVEQPGQFSLRGGILDIYPSTDGEPVRLEFFGDLIESLRPFNPVSQRSHGALGALTLFPAREVLLTPERVAAALPAIRAALQTRLGEISHAPIRLPGEDGTEELLSPAERLTAKIGNEAELLEQRAYFTGVEYYLPYLYPEGATLLDYLPPTTAVVLDELEHLAHAFHRFREGLAQLESSRLTRGALLPIPQPLYLPLPDGLGHLAQFPAVALSLLPPGIDASFTDPAIKSAAEDDDVIEEDAEPRPTPKTQNPRLLDGALVDLPAYPPVNYALQPAQLQPDLLGWVQGHYALVVVTHQEHRLAEMLTGYGIPARSGEAAQPSRSLPLPLGTALVRRAELAEGIILPTAGLVLLTDGEILGWQKQRRSVRQQHTQGQALAHVGQLTPGDYVVHINHGIGRYAGLVRRDVLGIEREFLEVDYAGADKLFVPVDQLDRVQKYIGLDERPPEVHRLGGGTGSAFAGGQKSPPKSWPSNCCSSRRFAPGSSATPSHRIARGSGRWRKASPGRRPPTSSPPFAT